MGIKLVGAQQVLAGCDGGTGSVPGSIRSNLGIHQRFIVKVMAHKALRLPPAGDAVAINAVLLAAVQHLALTGEARPGTGGVALDEAGWARIEGALDALLAAFPD